MADFRKLLCLLSLFMLCSCDYIFPSTWNYRITVEIETPEGIKSGSAVREVNLYKRQGTERAYSYLYFLGQTIGSVLAVGEASFWMSIQKPKFVGEAVVIDLGERGVAFALVGHGSYKEVYRALPPPPDPKTRRVDKFKDTADKMDYYPRLKLGTKGQLQKPYPKIVRFMDMDDPKSLKLVQGLVFDVRTQKQVEVNDFEEVFGAGVHLKRIMIEITNDPVTWGLVDKYLPESFYDVVVKGWQQLSLEDQRRLNNLIGFKEEQKE